MRSRTTKTPAKVESEANRLGVTPESFLAHSDQYRSSSFDVVATSIGNAFYQTIEDDEGNLMYKFEPTEEGIKFIKRLGASSETEESLQEFIYNKIYLARSLDLVVSSESGVICGKGDCLNKSDCGFIPNYPMINFGNIDELSPDVVPSPKNRWIGIEKCKQFFENYIEGL
jgi:hypothetical protein